MTTWPELLKTIFANDKLLYAVLSSPVLKESSFGQKITIQPVVTKDGTGFQISTHRGPQVFHQNVKPAECQKFLDDCMTNHFKQALICTEKADHHILVSKKQKMTILNKSPTRSGNALSPVTHNRTKQYLLEEGTPIPFLIALGVMNRDGKVIPAKRDKFRQLNRFLEMIDDVLDNFPKDHKLHIVDFGCGKAYLTFALYHFLSLMHGFDINIHGLDLKKEVIEHCQALSDELGYSGLKFAVGDINKYNPQNKVDMMISLHACDTATDAALEKAIRWNAEVILCVPCCQHELMRQVKSDTLTPIMRHGILKERFAALATDAARAQLLDILGYNTQVLEFIDLEHTPKNLLIRAVKKKTIKPSPQALKDYIAFKQALQIEPSLEHRFKSELST